jgi:ubiquinone/menaquinone biosynthesis C-methylase UbiE
MKGATLFDPWPERYDQWFETPIGKLIKAYETELILDMLRPSRGERILDAGCGTGVFSRDLVLAGATVAGLELSFPMLVRAGEKLSGTPFLMIQGDMSTLPFADHVFDKTVSVTAIEFIKDARGAVDELFRVTRPGGLIVVATLNSLSPWATRRRRSGKEGHILFQDVVFRSPEDIKNLSEATGIQKTAIHFQKEEDPETARKIESKGRSRGLDSGAFLACCWQKP